MGVFPVPQQGLVGRSSGKPDVLDNLQGLTLFNAYRPQLPGGNVNDGTNVTEIKDWKSGFDLAEFSGAVNPEILSGGIVNFNHKRLATTATRSDYQFMSDGSDFTIVTWMKKNSASSSYEVLAGTNNGLAANSSSNQGFSLFDTASAQTGIFIDQSGANKVYGFASVFEVYDQESGQFIPDLNLGQLVAVFKNIGVGQVYATYYWNGVQKLTANLLSTITPSLPLGPLIVGSPYSTNNNPIYMGNFQQYDMHILKGAPAGNDLTTIFNTPANYYS